MGCEGCRRCTQQIYCSGKGNRTTCGRFVSSCIQINIRPRHGDAATCDFNNTQINLGRVSNGKAGQVIGCCAIYRVGCITDIADHVDCAISTGAVGIQSQAVTAGIYRTYSLAQDNIAAGGRAIAGTDGTGAAHQNGVSDVNITADRADVGIEEGRGTGADDGQVITGTGEGEGTIYIDIRTTGRGPEFQTGLAERSTSRRNGEITGLSSAADNDFANGSGIRRFQFGLGQHSRCIHPAQGNGGRISLTSEGDSGGVGGTRGKQARACGYGNVV